MSHIPKELSTLNKFDFERPPVGIKYVFNKPKDLKRQDKVMDFCEMLVEAQQGKTFYVDEENFSCIGAILLGMK